MALPPRPDQRPPFRGPMQSAYINPAQPNPNVAGQPMGRPTVVQGPPKPPLGSATINPAQPNPNVARGAMSAEAAAQQGVQRGAFSAAETARAPKYAGVRAAPAQAVAGLKNAMSSAAGRVASALPRPTGALATMTNAAGRAATSAPAKNLMRGAGKLHVAGSAIRAVSQSWDAGADEKYEKRFNFAAPKYDGTFADGAKMIGGRMIGALTDYGNNLFLGAPKALLYRDDGTEDAATPVTVTQADTAAQEAPGGVISAQTPATIAQGAPTAQNAVKPVPETLAGTDLGGGVRRVLGNEQKGIPLYTNATSNAADYDFATGKGGTVSTVGNLADANATNQRALEVMKQMRAMREGQMDQGDLYAYAEAAGQQPGGINQDLSRQIRRLTAGGGRLSATANQTLTNLLGVQAQLRNQDMDSADRQAATAQTGRIAGLQARMQQAQQDREFGLSERKFGMDQQKFEMDQQKFGVDTALKMREADAKRVNDSSQRRIASEAQLMKKLEVMHPGDPERVAQKMQGFQSMVGARMQALQAEIAKGGPNAKQAQAEYDMLDEDGVNALPPSMLEDARKGDEIKSRLKDRGPIDKFFGGENYVDSQNPLDYLPQSRTDATVGKPTYKTANGSTLNRGTIDGTEPDNLIFTDAFGTKSSDLTSVVGPLDRAAAKKRAELKAQREKANK